MQFYDNLALFRSLEELGVIPQDKLKKAFESTKTANKPLGEVLLEKDLISDQNLGKIIASIAKIPFVSLSTTAISDEMLLVVPEIVARNSQIIAFEKTAEGLKLAMANPSDSQVIEFIGKKTGEKIIPYFATGRDIENALRLYQKEE